MHITGSPIGEIHRLKPPLRETHVYLTNGYLTPFFFFFFYRCMFCLSGVQKDEERMHQRGAANYSLINKLPSLYQYKLRTNEMQEALQLPVSAVMVPFSPPNNTLQLKARIRPTWQRDTCLPPAQ